MKNQMFNKLRNKFLVLIMSIFSVVMIASLAVIYFATYNRMQVEINRIYESGNILHGELIIEPHNFVEVMGPQMLLSSLFTTLLVVGLIMIGIIFAVSFYFANRAIKPIADNWEKQKQFIADASHELKTPLTIIKSNYDMLLSNRDETVASQLEWLGYMKVGADRMETLISDLLDLARMDGATMQLQYEPFDMSEVVEGEVQSMEAIAGEKGIQIFKDIMPGVVLNSNQERITRVLAILLENAIKYTDNDGRIDIKLRTSKQEVHCIIKNSGKGIPQNELPKIFDRFYRPDDSRNSESGGYGLGLSIAKAAIELLGGSLSATSVEHESTTFSFTLNIK